MLLHTTCSLLGGTLPLNCVVVVVTEVPFRARFWTSWSWLGTWKNWVITAIQQKQLSLIVTMKSKRLVPTSYFRRSNYYV